MHPLAKQILSSGDRTRRPLKVAEWGTTVYVTTMTADERDAFEAATQKSNGADREANLRGIRARLAIATLEDADGNKIFGPEDAEELGKKSSLVLSRIFNVAAEINGLRNQDVETLVGNSEAGPDESSTSDSPATSTEASPRSDS